MTNMRDTDPCPHSVQTENRKQTNKHGAGKTPKTMTSGHYWFLIWGPGHHHPQKAMLSPAFLRVPRYESTRGRLIWVPQGHTQVSLEEFSSLLDQSSAALIWGWVSERPSPWSNSFYGFPNPQEFPGQWWAMVMQLAMRISLGPPNIVGHNLRTDQWPLRSPNWRVFIIHPTPCLTKHPKIGYWENSPNHRVAGDFIP